MYVCLSFDSLHLGSSYLHIRYISGEYGSSSYIKVIGSMSRSEERKRSHMSVHALINITAVGNFNRYSPDAGGHALD